MTKSFSAVTQLSDTDLLAEVKVAAGREREATARLIALLAQVDIRRLYLRQSCSSLFTYCTQVLHLSEHAAYGRIEAARAARKFPVVLDLLADGWVTLTAVTLLAPHLTPANHSDVLDAARHKSKREVEHIVARLRPQPAVPSTVRKLPVSQPSCECSAPSAAASHSHETSAFMTAPLSAPPRPPVVAPLAAERYKVQFTVSRDTHDKLRRAQDLLRHSIPNGDPAAIFDRALTLLLDDLERAKLAATARPRAPRGVAPGSRHIPAGVKRDVWTRDGGQCAFVGANGRCTERGFLEFHHVRPHADGGGANVENIQLRCRSHNGHEAEQYFGTRCPLLVREASRPAYCYSTRSGPSSARTLRRVEAREFALTSRRNARSARADLLLEARAFS
jgi:HNH endonuclease